MSNHQILNPADHLHLRVRTEAGALLGDGVMACLAIPAEFKRLACEFPILFRLDAESGAFSAHALFGLAPGENLFLQGDRWDASCKPLSTAIQPFLVGRGQDDDAPGQVHVDMDHPRVAGAEHGMRVFDDEGKPTPYLEKIADMLGALDAGYRASGEFYTLLRRYELLEPFSMDVTLDDGSSNRLVGYHLIDEAKLAALEPAMLNELHALGHLEAVYMAIASLGNLTKLVRRKNARGHG